MFTAHVKNLHDMVKKFTLQHLYYPIVHIYLCLTSIYHILLKLSCPYSWLIKQTKQTTTKTTIKKNNRIISLQTLERMLATTLRI